MATAAMTLIGFRSSNHPQQVAKRGPVRRVDDLATDPAFFAVQQARFGFTVDACASATNTKLPRYWSRENDGLHQPWLGERVWCNPPYSSIGPWVERGLAETATEGCPLAVMLLPANRTEQRWWQELIEPVRDRGIGVVVEFLYGRLRFIAPGEESIGPNNRPPFGCCLLILTPYPDLT